MYKTTPRLGTQPSATENKKEKVLSRRREEDLMGRDRGASGGGRVEGQQARVLRAREVGTARDEEALPVGQLDPGGQLLLPLGAPVLEPGLNLRFGEVELLRQLGPLVDAQVLVHLELGLEPVQLHRAVGLPRLPVDSRLA